MIRYFYHFIKLDFTGYKRYSNRIRQIRQFIVLSIVIKNTIKTHKNID